MGLLGDGFDDPQTQFNLALASGLLSSRGGFGQALGQAVPMAAQARQQAVNAIAQKQNQALQQKLTMAQIEETLAQASQRSSAAEKARRDAQNQEGITQYFSSLGSFDLPNGPTNAAAASSKPKEFDMAEFLRLPGAMNNMQMAKSYLDAKDSGRPAYTHFEKVQTPEGERVAGISKYGDQKVFDLTPRKATPQVQVSIGDKKFNEKLAELSVEGLGKSQARAQAAAQNIDAISRMNTALSRGILPTGPGASVGQSISRLADAAGIGGRDNAEKLSNTTELIRAASRIALDSSASMKGQGAISNEERRLLARAALGGDDILSMRPDELQALMRAIDRSSRQAISNHQKLLDRTEPDVRRWLPFLEVDSPATIDFSQPLPSSQQAAPQTPGQGRRINRPPVNWGQ